MGDDEGRGHDLEAEHALRRRLANPRPHERPEAATAEVGGDAAQHLGQIGTGAATRVEHVDVLGRESVRDVEVVLQRPVHAGHHVANHLRRRVPDTELLAQVRVEGFEEGLVEVRNCLAFVEAGEERLAVHPVERRRRPVQHLDQAERLEPSGVGELLEQRPQHRGAQVPHRLAPTEAGGVVAGVPGGVRPAADARSGTRARPQHPGGEDAVEQCLHQRRAEEARAPFTLEAHAQRVFEGGAHRLQRRRVTGCLDPRETVAGVGREQPRQVLRLGERGPVGQRAREILAQTRADRPRKNTRIFQPAGECLFALGQPKRLQHRLVAVRVWADQAELAQVRDQHQAVAAPIARHLLAHRPRPQVLVRRLHLDDAALRCLSLARAAALHLLRGVESEVGMARALVGKLADAEHLGLQCRAHRVQKIRERPVARPLAGGSARGADPPQIVEVRLDRRGQLRIGSAHRARCRRVRPDMQAPRPKQPRRLLARETPGKRRFGIGHSGWNSCRRRSGAASPRPASEVAGAARRRPRTKPARRRPGPARGPRSLDCSASRRRRPASNGSEQAPLSRAVDVHGALGTRGGGVAFRPLMIVPAPFVESVFRPAGSGEEKSGYNVVFSRRSAFAAAHRSILR